MPDDDALRRADHDRWLAAQFAPARERGDLLTLAAFHLEIARVRAAVRERMLGDIRLAWWRETVEALYTGVVRRHAVAEALAPVIARHRLPQSLFQAMIEARAADLDDHPFTDEAALEAYAAATASGPMQLGARVLSADEGGDEAARHAGIAYAYSGLLRALAFHAAQGRLMLPLSWFTEAGADPDAFVSGRMSPEARRVCVRLADRAAAHLTAARAAWGTAARQALPALLPATLVIPVVRAVRRPDFDPFRAPATAGFKHLRMLTAALRGRI